MGDSEQKVRLIPIPIMAVLVTLGASLAGAYTGLWIFYFFYTVAVPEYSGYLMYKPLHESVVSGLEFSLDPWSMFLLENPAALFTVLISLAVIAFLVRLRIVKGMSVQQTETLPDRLKNIYKKLIITALFFIAVFIVSGKSIGLFFNDPDSGKLAAYLGVVSFTVIFFFVGSEGGLLGGLFGKEKAYKDVLLRGLIAGILLAVTFGFLGTIYNYYIKVLISNWPLGNSGEAVPEGWNSLLNAAVLSNAYFLL